MADPVTWLLALNDRYGPTVAGLVIGTAAKYGLTLTEGRKLTWRGAIADLLLLGMLGLIAVVITDWMALTGNVRVLAGALTAVSSDRLVRLVRDWFLKRASTDLGTAIRQTDGLAKVPPGPAPAGSAKLMIFKNADPRTAGIERLAEDCMPNGATRADFDKLLTDIDRADAAAAARKGRPAS